MSVLNKLIKVIDPRSTHRGQFGHIREQDGTNVLVEFEGETGLLLYGMHQIKFADEVENIESKIPTGTYVKITDHDDERYGEVGVVREIFERDTDYPSNTRTKYRVKFEGTPHLISFFRDQFRVVGEAMPIEDRPEEMLKHENFDPQAVAVGLVHRLFYGEETNTPLTTDDVYIVWFANTLQNWKALVSTNAKDNMYYEVTHNGDKNETYIDAYQKVTNIKVDGEYNITVNNMMLF